MALLLHGQRTHADPVSFQGQGHDALLQDIAHCKHERLKIQRRSAATYTDERAFGLTSAALGSLCLDNASTRARMNKSSGS